MHGLVQRVISECSQNPVQALTKLNMGLKMDELMMTNLIQAMEHPDN